MNKTSLDAPITTTVAALSDQRLLQRVKELSAIEHYLQGVVIDHLREVERRQLYLTRGFSSMYDYAMRELGYSTGAAWRRLKAMRLCDEVKGARGRLLEGTLTLDAAAQLQYAFEQQERKARRSPAPDTEKQAGGGRGTQAAAESATPVMEPGARAAVALGGSAPDVAAHEAGPAAGAAGAPSGSEADAPVRAPERPAAPVPDAAEREALVAQAAGKSTRQVKEMLAKVDPDLARTADRMRPLGAGRWELKAVIDDGCQVGLEQLKGLLSHVDPQMTLGQLLGRVVREALDRHDPSRPPRGRRRRRTPDVADQTSAPKTPAGPDAAAAQQSGMPAGSATSAPNVSADAGHRRVTVAKRPAVATRAAAVTAETSAPKEAVAAPGTEQPAGAATAPARVQAADRPAAAAGIAISAPKAGGGSQPAAHRSGRLVTPATAPPQPRVRGRAIPAAVRRQVWERDGGCCSYVDPVSGRRCGSRHLLEIDHVVPYALGGSAEPDNLRLLCAAHHRYRHRHARLGAAAGRSGTCQGACPKPVPSAL